MSLLPRVTERARELLAREFDTRGPDACMSEIIEHLERHNPELLDMAAKCAADLGIPRRRCSVSACSIVFSSRLPPAEMSRPRSLGLVKKRVRCWWRRLTKRGQRILRWRRLRNSRR